MKAFFFRLLAVLTLAAATFACGDDETTPTATQPSPSPSAIPSPVATPTPSPSPTPGPPTGTIQTFAGIIDSIESSTVVNVSDRMVEVDEDTKLFRQKTPITFADLRVGDDVLVNAMPRSDGTWLAVEMKVRPR